jgi:hypothetical protein
MLPLTLHESKTITVAVDLPREDIAISIYPITGEQWHALRDIATGLGVGRAELMRDAITHLLDERDAGVHIPYLAAPRLTQDEKAESRPRALWLMPPLFERLRERCTDDRVSQSEFVLEALRRHLADKDIDITPPI